MGDWEDGEEITLPAWVPWAIVAASSVMLWGFLAGWWR